MFEHDFLQKLSARAAALFPAVEAKRKELEQDLYALLQASLGKLNVVTSEEFAAQLKVLAQAQTKIAELESRISELESRDRH